MGFYRDQCGGLPSENYPDMDVAAWWDCACRYAIIRGVCSSNGYGFMLAVFNDVQTEEGTAPYLGGTSSTPDGDYVTIYYNAGDTNIYMGRYLWKCPDVEEAEITEIIYPTSDVVVGSTYDVQVTMKNNLSKTYEFRFRLKEGTTEIDHSVSAPINPGVWWTATLSGVMPNRTLNLTMELWRIE